MSSGFETPISINEAVKKIDERKFLLPALQRKFVWNTSQIEVLFDSLLQNYPINSFMFWEVTDPSIKSNLKFYEFLKSYRQRYGEENPPFNTINHTDFYAVIDGQQRLTSLYIGLKGSYAYKIDRKHWRDDEEALPTRYLYLNLKEALPDENERNMKYNFMFLTPDEAMEDNNELPDQFDWFCITEIFRYPTLPAIITYSNSKGYNTHPFSQDTLIQLHNIVYERKLINYYLEKNQEIDVVLDIFIRTNSGGTFLSFSDLLMSIITANWKKEDARKQIQEVVNKVFEIKDKEFQISKDFVLKACLVLLGDNIKFKAGNFDSSNIESFESHWQDIKKAILTAFELAADFGLSNRSLRAKNALIPVIYFIYHKGTTADILHPLKYKEDKLLIQKWINLSLLKGVFGGQSDAVLTRLRKVIKEGFAGKTPQEKLAVSFPLQSIKAEFAADPSKNLHMNEEFIEELLRTQKDDGACFSILSLLYPHIDFYNQDFHKDHLHPAVFFYNEQFYEVVPEADWAFYEDAGNWNSILNLQLLNSHLNKSKLDKKLSDWVITNSIDYKAQIIPENCDLDVTNFRNFIAARKGLLISRIKELI